MKRFPVAFALLTLTMLPSAGQEGKSETRIQIKKMEIPSYVPLARQAGVSGDVTLHLTVNKSGEVASVDVVSARPPKGWGEAFAAVAIEAAKRSQFSCASCAGDTFEHTVTYQFDFPPVPDGACMLQPPPIPPSKIDSVSHVTVRPKAWTCVQP
jgi:TonB family protein